MVHLHAVAREPTDAERRLEIVAADRSTLRIFSLHLAIGHQDSLSTIAGEPAGAEGGLEIKSADRPVEIENFAG